MSVAALTFGCNGHLTPGEICYRKFRPASNAADLGRYSEGIVASFQECIYNP
jgi:hypothetical protein